MHIVFFNTKGGVGKSTLCEYTARGLERIGYVVESINIDQQQHITERSHNEADHYLYDTQGSFTAANTDLLESLAGADDGLLIMPIGLGVNDLKEAQFVLSKLDEYGLVNRTIIVFTRTRKNSRVMAERREQLAEQAKGVRVAEWFMPNLDAFATLKDNKRTINEIDCFVKEVIL